MDFEKMISNLKKYEEILKGSKLDKSELETQRKASLGMIELCKEAFDILEEALEIKKNNPSYIDAVDELIANVERMKSNMEKMIDLISEYNLPLPLDNLKNKAKELEVDLKIMRIVKSMEEGDQGGIQA
jgi:hypothetical protein